MADVVRAKFKGKDVGDGAPYLHGIPNRDLTDEDFDLLDEDRKHLVRTSDLYEYVPYTEKARTGKPVRAEEPTKQPADPSATTEGENK